MCLLLKGILAEIMFLISPDECWIHTAASDFTGSSNNNNGYDSYKKSINCVTGTATPDCVPGYSQHTGSSSLNGVRVPNVNTVDACKEWCSARSECGAFDFNSANECFWHNNGDWENNLRTGSSGVSQYRKNPCPGTGSPTGTGGTGTGKNFSNNYQSVFYVLCVPHFLLSHVL